MLLSVVRKILTSIITRRATDQVDDYVAESQAGFRPGRSTADGIFFTRSMCERALLGNWHYSAALLDFGGAFDTVIRSKALERMDAAGMSTATAATLVSNTSARVKLNGHLSVPFDTNIGVVQGDPMSPLMFITYAEGTMKEIRAVIPPNSSLPTQFTQYADDTTIHNTNVNDTKNIVNSSQSKFAGDNLMLNMDKTKFITVSKAENEWKSVKLLGSLLGTTEDISNRISAANRAFSSIEWKHHCLPSRLAMFQSLVLLVHLDIDKDS